MPTSAAPSRELAHSWPLRGVAAAALAVSAWLHVDLASGPLFSADGVTLAGLFVAQAAVAALAAVALLVRGSRLVWAGAGVVGLASLAALVLSVYVAIPALGPFPPLYEPFWYGEKAVAALTAAVAAAAAAVALTMGRQPGAGSR